MKESKFSLNGYPNMIDRNSRVPLYAQVKEVLFEYVKSSGLPPGEFLATEEQICRQLNISRVTVRKAIDELVMEGLLQRKKAKGVYIAKPKIKEGMLQSLDGLYNYMTSKGGKPISKVLEYKKELPGKEIAEILRLEENDTILLIKRLRFFDNEPFVISYNYLPTKICSELPLEELKTGSLYHILERDHKIKFYRAYRTIEVSWPTEEEARLLRIPQGQPIQLLRSISYFKDGTPAEFLKGIFRADRCRFEVELRRQEGR